MKWRKGGENCIARSYDVYSSPSTIYERGEWAHADIVGKAERKGTSRKT
jgi:hypothetical protein